MTEQDRQRLLDRITVDPQIQGGRPVIKGTRVPVSKVVGALSAGATAKELCDDYGLQEEDVIAALAYAAKSVKDTEITIKKPSDCTPTELGSFESLVLQGGEVQQQGLQARIQQARLLGFAYRNSELVSIAAVKRPTNHHSSDVFRSSGSQASLAEFQHEYGWAFTVQSDRGLGHATRLLDQLLASDPTLAIWATTREDNVSIHQVLMRHGFARSGTPFLSERGRYLVLWIRPSRPVFGGLVSSIESLVADVPDRW